MALYKKFSFSSHGYSPQRTTALVLNGTFLAVLLLSLLLVIYNGIIQSVWLNDGVWILIIIFGYLFLARLLLKKDRQQITNWMLVSFYLLLAFATLLLWGLNAPIGILTVSFALVLPSILMGARAIMPVVLLTIAVLTLVQHIHESGFIKPELSNLSLPSTYWDVISYSTILAIFALVSWIASNQREKNLHRALKAEAELKKQKQALSIELEKESAELRLAQLNQIRQIHKFALLGQSTAATLHELSNHLSILNFDINDLHRQNSNSDIISSAKDNIEHINKMVRQARRQLNSYDQIETFDAIAVIRQSTKDLAEKFMFRHLAVPRPTIHGKRAFITHSSRLALMQIITILLNNALDACYDTPNAAITIEIENKGSELIIHIRDTGVGIDPQIAKELFRPITSEKPAGLGIGLYIAHHLTQDQLAGKIELQSSKLGAHFVITLPKLSSRKTS